MLRCYHSEKTNRFVNARRKSRNLSKVFDWNVLFVILLSVKLSLAQISVGSSNPSIADRDPRFYSRPGVDYRPPTPGDKDYRWNWWTFCMDVCSFMTNFILTELMCTTTVAMATTSHSATVRTSPVKLSPNNIQAIQAWAMTDSNSIQ